MHKIYCIIIDRRYYDFNEWKDNMMNYVYIVECSDGTLYTGWTNNLDKRIEQHCNGTGAKYTRGRGPVRLVYHEEFNDKRDAMRREYEIKRYSRINKLKLIENMQKYDKK